MAGLSNRTVSLVVAILVANASLSFRNVWPTPAITWTGALSVEFLVCLLGLTLLSPLVRRRPSLIMRGLAALWVVLVLGRYAEVTAPALYGRPVNLYWDLRFVPAVAAMLARPAAWWILLVAIAIIIVVPLVLYVILRRAWGVIVPAVDRPVERRTLGGLAAAGLALFAAQPYLPAGVFTPPAVKTFARQARLAWTSRGARTIAATPSFDSDLSRVEGADVLLVFVESYGAISYDRPELAERLRPSRKQLETTIAETGRQVVSAFVESPTFGGSSWLAHVSLLSGVEARDEDTNIILMSQKRDSLVRAFSRHGYRTIAIMPGLQSSWPEGEFYGFDDIYGELRLDYRGSSFGWWSIPDQVAIAKMDALAMKEAARPPVFVFFPTTSTHTPFTPTPPYQRDWPRLLTEQPYDAVDENRVWLETPDWLDLGPSYARALAYAYDSFAGYLRLRADRDFVLILIGDHQPPAAVSGEQARWDVPMHVIASRRAVLDALAARGFGRGLTPTGPAIARMHELGPILLEAF